MDCPKLLKGTQLHSFANDRQFQFEKKKEEKKSLPEGILASSTLVFFQKRKGISYHAGAAAESAPSTCRIAAAINLRGGGVGRRPRANEQTSKRSKQAELYRS